MELKIQNFSEVSFPCLTMIAIEFLQILNNRWRSKFKISGQKPNRPTIPKTEPYTKWKKK
jgi:hypothetical protein